MQLQELDMYFRVLTSEPDPTARWSQPDVANLINQARLDIARELDYPQGSLFAPTSPGVQEYSLPGITKILRVYLGGQTLIPTSIPTLQGDQLELYDQTGPLNTPQWLSVAAIAYPTIGQSFANGYPNTLPFMQGAPSQWYQRGIGIIGFVPPPLGAYPIQIDIVPRPAMLVNPTDNDNCYDQMFKEAIVQGALMRAMQSDRDTEARLTAGAEFAKQLSRLQDWVRDFTTGTPRGPMVKTYRGYYQMGSNIPSDS